MLPCCPGPSLHVAGGRGRGAGGRGLEEGRKGGVQGEEATLPRDGLRKISVRENPLPIPLRLKESPRMRSNGTTHPRQSVCLSLGTSQMQGYWWVSAAESGVRLRKEGQEARLGALVS